MFSRCSSHYTGSQDKSTSDTDSTGWQFTSKTLVNGHSGELRLNFFLLMCNINKFARFGMFSMLIIITV